jgi:hypothetical protein
MSRLAQDLVARRLKRVVGCWVDENHHEFTEIAKEAKVSEDT